MSERGRSRRVLLRAMLAGAGGSAAAAVAGCAGPAPGDPASTPDPTAGGDGIMPGDPAAGDDLPPGVTLTDRGHAVFDPPDHDSGHRIAGAAAVLTNTTDRPMRVHLRHRFTDAEGHGWHNPDTRDWAGVTSPGLLYLPPHRPVAAGDITRIPTADADRIAGIALYALADTPPVGPAVFLTAHVTALRPRDRPDDYDHVAFTVDNDAHVFTAPDYVLAYRDADGALTAGWFVDRAHWVDIESALPAGETDQYPTGTSTHTLPVWLPPGITAGDVSMHLWT